MDVTVLYNIGFHKHVSLLHHQDLYELGLVGGQATHRRHSAYSQRSQGPHEVSGQLNKCTAKRSVELVRKNKNIDDLNLVSLS